MTKVEAKAGQLIKIESGCYSDYGVHGFFVALRDFDPMEQRKAWIDLPREANEWGYMRRQDFIAFLIRQGLLLEIEHDSMHLGDYGDVDDFSYNGVAYKKEPTK
jgi:hypothetical protein